MTKICMMEMNKDYKRGDKGGNGPNEDGKKEECKQQ